MDQEPVFASGMADASSGRLMVIDDLISFLFALAELATPRPWRRPTAQAAKLLSPPVLLAGC